LDRLIAISTSATRFAEHLRSDRYFTGIWGEDLSSGIGLCWYSIAAEFKPGNNFTAWNQIADGAPLWSWALVTGAVAYARRKKWKLDFESSPRIVSVDYVVPEENPFGCPSRTSITVHGKVIRDVKLKQLGSSGSNGF